MGAKLTFVFTLDRDSVGYESACNIWVDTKRTIGKTDDDVPVKLERKGLAWVGTLDLDTDSAERMYFNVVYRAALDATWSCFVSSDKPDTHVVFQDSRRVTRANDSFWARCSA